MQFTTSDATKTEYLQSQIFTWLIEESKKNNSLEQDRLWLDGDSLLVIVAGRYLIHQLKRDD